jgi:predicted DNA-binding protein
MTPKIEKETKKSLYSMRSEISRNFSPYLRENVRVHISERPSIYLIFVRVLHQIKKEINYKSLDK